MNYKKGFSLIELLLIIAIIGTLSSVVLSSVSSARIKAQNAVFKAELASLRGALNDICATRSLTPSDVLAAGARSAGSTTALFVAPLNFDTARTPGADLICILDGTFAIGFTPNPAITGGCTAGIITESYATTTGC